jgi:uncharacterized protein
MMHTVHLADCPFVPWANGGGRTRELLAWPRRDDWVVRVSVAEIEADGPFSSLAGIDRCFAVLDGAGVVLALPCGEQHLTPHDAAVAFPGEAAPMCRLLDGPTRDLNLMVRRGAGRPVMRRGVFPKARWSGLFDGVALHWTDIPHESYRRGYAGWALSMEAP